MTTFYVVCAVLGGTVLACQFVMTLLGLDHADVPDDVPHDFGHDLAHGGQDSAHDAHSDHNQSWFFGVLTFRTVVAALTFFGIAGLAGTSADWPTPWTLVVSTGAGAGAMFGVHWMMQALHKLRADGTVRIQRAVGRPASVYLRIPSRKSGVGKVQVNVQNRTMEYEAMTSQEEELPVGARVVVVDVVGPETVEVELAPDHERTSHV
ncbi:MAG TPA: hypothetical protein VND64_28710 [Pirellulales bacterium]|nr:hypothetical protein [Pirellulales bacterium]